MGGGAVSEFWIVRHTSVEVPAGTCYGRTDVPLRETFAGEAALVLKQLQGERFDRVWTSPLTRCTRLAAFCGYADACRDDRLREIDFGAWEMQRFDQIRDPQLLRWYDDWLHVRPTGGESFDDQCRRVGAFLDEVAAQGLRRVLVFAHGGVQLAAGIRAGLYTAREAFQHQLGYGEILRIDL